MSSYTDVNMGYVAVKDGQVVLVDGSPKYAPRTLSTATMIYVAPNAEIYAKYGFLPYIEGPSGSPDRGYEWAEDGYTVEDGIAYKKWKQVKAPPPSLEEFDRAMEEHLIGERSERGYTTREPDSYLTSANPRWSQDARDWVAHRDEVMAYALELINEVQSGQREPPTMDEFVEGLPNIVWTYVEGQVSPIEPEPEVETTVEEGEGVDEEEEVDEENGVDAEAEGGVEG